MTGNLSGDNLKKIMKNMSWGSVGEDFVWHVDKRTNEMRFLADCSDTFQWADVDHEEITDDNVDLYISTIEELEKIDPRTLDFGVPCELFAARVRKQLPMDHYFEYISKFDPKVADLFREAAK